MLWMRGFLIVLLAAHTVVALAETQSGTQAAPSNSSAEQDRFDVFEYQVVGNSVLSH